MSIRDGNIHQLYGLLLVSSYRMNAFSENKFISFVSVDFIE